MQSKQGEKIRNKTKTKTKKQQKKEENTTLKQLNKLG